MLSTALILIQLFFTMIIGVYFFTQLKTQQSGKNAMSHESKKELEKITKMEKISLTVPLAEKTRPASVNDIVGQKEGIKALTAALCGPNPQHVIIYGPPGVGKTAAARIILEKAKNMDISPFDEKSKFIEADATIMRFDERSVADPLIGSVHDPIYQGAGAYGPAGIPQPKPGAVTKAHGGVLFIDEIGELHPVQMNRLLKVLEDRKVFFESAYYSTDDKNIPSHIHHMFKKGLPADFRLIGATTRTPDEIPAAIRSRCVEIFFRPLTPPEISDIALNAAKKGGFEMEEGGEKIISKYAANGRDAVNIVQIAGSTALVEGRRQIKNKDIEWVIEFSRYSPRIEKKISNKSEIGLVNGLAVVGNSQGVVLEIEAIAKPVQKGSGKLTVTGIIEEEEYDPRGQKLKKSSTAKAAIENTVTLLKNQYNIDASDYYIHLNFPGSIPVDGPSAGIAVFCAIYSAIKKITVPSDITMTGEISIKGGVKPVGGVSSKINAAIFAGAKKVFIPEENYQQTFSDMNIEIVRVSDISQVIENVFGQEHNDRQPSVVIPQNVSIISADGAKS